MVFGIYGMRTGTLILCTLQLLAGAAGGLLLSATTLAADRTYKGPHIENEEFLVVLKPRTPEQMAAFYEARGFPPRAIERIRQTCFVTVHIENKGNQVLWLEQKNWQYSSDGRNLRRLDRDYWANVWEEIDLPQANRSTFGWTQLPDVRDLQPNEPVGGNVVLPGTTETFNIDAHFLTGKNKRKGMRVIRFENVQCPRDGVAP